MSKTPATALIIGADVGSTEVVFASAEPSRVLATVANQPAALRRWLHTLPVGSLLGMEATGRYHWTLADLAVEMGLTVYVLNPKDVAYYARGLGQRGKSDRLDACVIARYIEREGKDLHAYRRPTAAQREIATLLQQRATLVKHAGALRQSLRGASGLGPALKQARAALSGLVGAIERRLRALMGADALLEARRRRIETILGVGPVISTAFAYRFDRVPYANSDAAVAGFGLDPRLNESGQFVGQRKLSKRGNPEARRLAYLAAFSAARTAVWKPYYESLLARGLSPTAAYCALARKIVRVAFALWRTGKTFDPALIGSPKVQKTSGHRT